MVTRKQSVQNFNDRMSDLVNAKFIVAEKKISEVLISISDSVLLFELFQHVTEGFDYATFKSVCFSYDGQGNGYFKLPKTDADVLALGFSVLMDIDSGKTDVLNLCSEFFPSQEGKQRSYSLFATQLLIPFQQTALKIANSVIESEDSEETEEKEDCAEAVKEAEKDTEKKELSALDLSYLKELQRECEEIASTLKRGREPYDELSFALEEMEKYLIAKNLRGTTLAFTAIKHIKQSVKKIKVDCDKIAQIIAEAAV